MTMSINDGRRVARRANTSRNPRRATAKTTRIESERQLTPVIEESGELGLPQIHYICNAYTRLMLGFYITFDKTWDEPMIGALSSDIEPEALGRARSRARLAAANDNEGAA